MQNGEATCGRGGLRPRVRELHNIHYDEFVPTGAKSTATVSVPAPVAAGGEDQTLRGARLYSEAILSEAGRLPQVWFHTGLRRMRVGAERLGAHEESH